MKQECTSQVKENSEMQERNISTDGKWCSTITFHILFLRSELFKWEKASGWFWRHYIQKTISHTKKQTRMSLHLGGSHSSVHKGDTNTQCTLCEKWYHSSLLVFIPSKIFDLEDAFLICRRRQERGQGILLMQHRAHKCILLLRLEWQQTIQPPFDWSKMHGDFFHWGVR